MRFQKVADGPSAAGERPRAPSACTGRMRESPPPAAATRRPGRVALVSFDGPSGALSRSSERSIDCGQPSMHFFRLPSIAAAAACRFRQRPQALSAASVSVGGGLHARDWIPRPRAAPHSRGRPPRLPRDTSRRDSPALRPAVARSSANVSEGSRRPSAVSGMPLPPPNRRHGVPYLARCISPVAAVFSQRGTWVAGFRDRVGFPRQTPDCSRRVRLPGLPGFPGSRP